MSAFYYSPAGRGGSSMRFRKRKSRFTFNEVQLLLNEVKKNRHIVIGKFNKGVSSDVKKRTWAEITARINEISECPREIIEIIKKWSDLKCDTKRKVAAMRAAGEGSLRAGNSRITRDLSPVENMVHQILQLPPPDDRANPGRWSRLNRRKNVEENGDKEKEEEEDATMLRMHPTSAPVSSSPNGLVDVPALTTNSQGMAVPMVLPVSMSIPPSMPMSMPHSMPTSSNSAHRRESGMPTAMYISSYDAAVQCYDLQYEITGAEDQAAELENSDDEQHQGLAPSSLIPPRASAAAAAEEEELVGMHHRATIASTSRSSPAFPGPSLSAVSTSPAPPPVPMSAQDRLAQQASLSVQEQHTTNMLMETVSRSLEMLSESVQQLVETQQEFVRDSLRMQRETVHVLRDFSNNILAVMSDKLNGRPAP